MEINCKNCNTLYDFLNPSLTLTKSLGFFSDECRLSFNKKECSKCKTFFYSDNKYCYNCNDKNCKNCNKKYKLSLTENDFCSNECEIRFTTKCCDTCKKDFMDPNYTEWYCSPKCKEDGTKSCIHCSKSFLVKDRFLVSKSYCSYVCEKEHTTKKCYHCNETYLSSKQGSDENYCSEYCKERSTCSHIKRVGYFITDPFTHIAEDFLSGMSTAGRRC